MPKGYLFSVDGKITSISFKSGKTYDDITPSLLGKEYQNEASLYMKAIPEDLFLLMHEDNDFLKNYQNSTLGVNQALRKYFPNSPFKGNVLIVRLDDEDQIVGGWSRSILSSFRLGYVDDLEINEPVIISRKDDLKIKDEPIPKKKVKTTPNPSAKKCKECGLTKDFFHAQQCILQRTRLIIEKINDLLGDYPDIAEHLKGSCADVLAMECVSWKKFTKFPDLKRKGLNLISLRWIDFYLGRFYSDHYSELGKRTILDGVISMLYCFDRNSRFDFNSEECPDCRECEDRTNNPAKIDPNECREIRKKGFEVITRWLDRLEYDGLEKFSEMKKMVFPHLTLHIFSQFFSQLNQNIEKRTPVEKDSIEPVVIGMIFNWATLLIEEYEISKTMSEVDRELFG